MNDLDLGRTANRLVQLKQEHRDLDAAIDHMRKVNIPDELAITRLKKRKLSLKDMISKLESDLIPDEPA